MSTWEIKSSDFGLPQPFTITYKDGTIFDLTGYTVNLRVWSGIGATRVLKTTITGSLDANPSTGICYFTPIVTDFGTAGEYYFEIKLTKTGTEVKSDTFTVNVLESSSGL